MNKKFNKTECVECNGGIDNNSLYKCPECNRNIALINGLPMDTCPFCGKDIKAYVEFEQSNMENEHQE